MKNPNFGEGEKAFSVLKHFARGNRLHRFSAERLGDHVLPTTISDLQKKHGIYFERRTISVPNRFGSKTRVSEYWLEGKSLIKAKSITTGFAKKSNADSKWHKFKLYHPHKGISGPYILAISPTLAAKAFCQMYNLDPSKVKVISQQPIAAL
jgi:hypothetical protein